MKVQKRRNRKVGEKEYVKWYVNIPQDIIEELGWKEKTELNFETRNKKLTLRSKKLA